jgi:hypothetical protein
MTIEELGRRAVACKHWRWMEGMASLDIGWDQEGFTTWRDPETGELVSEPWTRGEWRTRGPFRLISDLDIYDGEEILPLVKRTAIPDLSDPATIGCLLALVEEAWKCPVDMSFAGACRLDVDAEERVYPQDHTVSFAAKTRVEALVLALEAAP